jgi:hypothetical protein
MEEAAAEDQVKVVVILEKVEDYPPVDYEEFWSTPMGEGRFRIENIPFFAKGLALGDIVSAALEEEVLRFQEVVEASGHSTIRVIVSSEDAVPAVVERFESLGCATETSYDRLVALDVPPSVSLDDVREKLDLGYAQSQWDYEEACIFLPGKDFSEEAAPKEDAES